MQRNLVLLFICGLLLLTSCSSGAGNQATPAGIHHRTIDAHLFQGSSMGDWPMFGYDPGHTGSVSAVVQPHAIQGKILWTQKYGPIFSSVIAGLSLLFVASTDGYLYALKQNTGQVIWRVKLGDYLTDATPVLEGQIVFVAVHSSALEALNARTGQLYWTFETQEKIQAPPLVVGGRVFLASRTTLWTLDATTGRLVWKFHQGVEGWPTTASPAYLGGTVYIGLGSTTQLWALNANDGKILWSFDTGDRITSTALVASDTVYVATWHGTLFALQRLNGQKRWSYTLNVSHNRTVVDGIAGSMALADGDLYMGDYRGSMLCIDSAKGQLKWRYATGAQILATPIVAAGLVYIGSSDGYFYALDVRGGRPAWRYQTGEIRTSAALANGHIYIGSITGILYAFA